MAETIHESRSLRQARPDGQGVDLPHKRNDLCKLLPQAGISSDGKIITLMKRFLQIAGGVSGRNDGKMRGSVRNRGGVAGFAHGLSRVFRADLPVSGDRAGLSGTGRGKCFFRAVGGGNETAGGPDKGGPREKREPENGTAIRARAGPVSWPDDLSVSRHGCRIIAGVFWLKGCER